MTRHLTRRRFIAAGGAAAAATTLSGGLAARAVARPGWFTRGSYTRRTGQLFTVRTAAGETSLRLDGVGDLIGTTPRGRPLAGRSDAFALRFSTASGPALEQGSFQVSHREFGRTTLFVVPGAGEGTYAVVVNRAR